MVSTCRELHICGWKEQKNGGYKFSIGCDILGIITISTVGYGDISPKTPEGRIVSMIIIISGIAMISLLHL